jgi:hypothetical protein
VKELNPGFDLLMAADWDELLAQGPLPLSAAQTKASAIPAEAELVPIPSGQETPEAAPEQAAPAAAAPAPAAQGYDVSYTTTSPVAAFIPRWIMVAGGGLLLMLILVAVVVAIAGASSTRRGPSD